MIQEIIIGVVLGLIVNEMFEVSPWLARKLVQWAAYHLYLNPHQREIRAEELAAVINSRPGKLFKLTTALAFTVGASTAVIKRFVQRSWLRLRPGHLATRSEAAMNVIMDRAFADSDRWAEHIGWQITRGKLGKRTYRSRNFPAAMDASDDRPPFDQQ